MSSLAIALPLTKDSGDGYTSIKDIKSMIKQNFKMLILTVPGERVMVPEYGVGMKTYLFNQFNDNTYAEIDSKIREQVKTYMPFIKIQEIITNSQSQDMNLLGLSIRYSIPRFGVTDLLEITI
jgi:phage baseplate assembly protein W